MEQTSEQDTRLQNPSDLRLRWVKVLTGGAKTLSSLTEIEIHWLKRPLWNYKSLILLSNLDFNSWHLKSYFSMTCFRSYRDVNEGKQVLSNLFRSTHFWWFLWLPVGEPTRELSLPASVTKTSITNLSPDVDYVVTIVAFDRSEESLPISGQITREWPSLRITESLNYRVTDWLSQRITESINYWVTEWLSQRVTESIN